MFNNVALDVFIGLVCIYLLYSLLASILMEAVAKYLGLRQRITLKAVYKLLDDSEFVEGDMFDRLCKSWDENRYMEPFKDRPLTALFYAHPNIKNLGNNSYNRKPSSITAEMFAETLIQILRGDDFVGQQNQVDLIKKNLRLDTAALAKEQTSIAEPFYYKISNYNPIDVKHFCGSGAGVDASLLPRRIKISSQTYFQLSQQLYNAHSDIDWFKKSLMTWFNEMMDRSEGWYIKQTRTILFVIGFLMAGVMNIDSIAIAKGLANDKNARDKMIEFASNLSKNQNFSNVSGLSDDALKKAFANAKSSLDEANSIIGPSLVQNNCGVKVLGWWITAFALSLGASFWFDLLGKIMCIRQGGNNSSTDAQKKVDKTLIDPTKEPVG